LDCEPDCTEISLQFYQHVLPGFLKLHEFLSVVWGKDGHINNFSVN